MSHDQMATLQCSELPLAQLLRRVALWHRSIEHARSSGQGRFFVSSMEFW